MHPSTKHVGCVVAECANKHYARGYCSKHYQQFVLTRIANGEWDKVKRGFRKTCSVQGCDNPHASNGFCEKHVSAANKDKNRQFILERYFKDGVVCPKCGKEFPMMIMDAHHPDPSKKEHSLSEMLNNSALQDRPELLSELDKCQMLCARCHQNTHHDPTTTHEATYGNKRKGRQIDRRKSMVREQVGENCVKCNDWLWPKEMEFHHRDKTGDKSRLSDMFRISSKEAIMEEVAKCDMTCRNCHRLIHMMELPNRYT